MQLRQEGLTWHAVGSDIVVLDLEGSTYLSVNGSGKLLWEALAEPRDLDELAKTLVERYGIDDDRAVADVEEFIAELRRRNLLVA